MFSDVEIGRCLGVDHIVPDTLSRAPVDNPAISESSARAPIEDRVQEALDAATAFRNARSNGKEDDSGATHVDFNISGAPRSSPWVPFIISQTKPKRRGAAGPCGRPSLYLHA